MKRWIRWLALLAALMLAGCASGEKQAEQGGGNLLRVGVRADILDFGYYNEQAGKYYGMEIELADEIARRLGYDGAEYVTVTAETRQALLHNGEVDCLVACVTVTEERAKTMDFSAPYYHDRVRLLTENSSLYTRVRSLQDGRVGVLSGSTAADALLSSFQEVGIVTGYVPGDRPRRHYNGLTVVYGASYSALSDMLERGEIDAMCADGCITRLYLTDERHYLEMDTPEFAYAVATNKGSKLSEPVAQAVDELLADGTVDSLIYKWG